MNDVMPRDAVTGLRTGCHLAAYWPKLARRARRGHPMALILVDIETPRNGAGLDPEAARWVARRLESGCTGADMVFRTAPSSFTVLIPDCTPRHVADLTAHIRQVLADSDMHVRLGVSMVGRAKAPSRSGIFRKIDRAQRRQRHVA